MCSFDKLGIMSLLLIETDHVETKQIEKLNRHFFQKQKRIKI